MKEQSPYDQITLSFDEQVVPKQGARAFVTKEGKVGHHTSGKVASFEQAIIWQVKSQLKRKYPGHIPYDEPIAFAATYIFRAPKKLTKEQERHMSKYGYCFKDTKPDLQDNMHKAICDAMEGQVYINDSRIAVVLGATKLYANSDPRIIITIARTREEQINHSISFSI